MWKAKRVGNKHRIININCNTVKLTSNSKIITEHSLQRRLIQRIRRSIHHLLWLLNKEEVNQSYKRHTKGFNQKPNIKKLSQSRC